jgi:hypothetical protein
MYTAAAAAAAAAALLANAQVSKLGPDPLRPSDDAERFWARVSSSRKPIGLLLMDQSAVAGDVQGTGMCQHIWYCSESIKYGLVTSRRHSQVASGWCVP